MVCSICDDSLFKPASKNYKGQGYRPAALSCGHVFHKSCINRWLSSSDSYECPFCGAYPNTDPMILRIELSAEDAKYIPSNSATVSRSRPADFDDLVEHVTRVSLREKRDAEKRELDIESKLKAAQDELNSVKNQMNDLQDNVNWYKDELDRMQQRSERHVENINGLQKSLHNRKCEIEELEEELEEYRRNDGYY